LEGGGGGPDTFEPLPPPANIEFACVLLRVGLGADTLAANRVESGGLQLKATF
jgi:hypothetical protein